MLTILTTLNNDNDSAVLIVLHVGTQLNLLGVTSVDLHVSCECCNRRGHSGVRSLGQLGSNVGKEGVILSPILCSYTEY